MLVMTIESSCDETSAALIRDGHQILSNAVASQIPVHQRYGGVVPELASRNHILDIHAVIDQALDQADLSLDDVDGFGVTAGPGLVGSLLVGIETARALAYAQNKPVVGLNHLEGHLTAVLLDHDDVSAPQFPYLGLIVSGGHTDLYIVHAIGDYELLGRTRDDAAGEAFDKVAKMLGLPYPGGVAIDTLAAQGNPDAIDFPRPMWTRSNLDFSFSGLKTAVANHLDEHPDPREQDLFDLCASFQEAVVDVLIMKTLAACKQNHLKRAVLSGGVACNQRLRHKARSAFQDANIDLFIAPPSLCTDNAAMLGPIAHAYLKDLDPSPGPVPIKAQANFRLGRTERPSNKHHR